MIERSLAGKPALLTFTKDYREFLRGDLVPGGAVDIYYDAERLPQVIDSPHAVVECQVSFKKGEVRAYRLQSAGGLLLRKSGKQPGGGSMLGAHIVIPPDAEQMELWFRALLGQRTLAYDSDHGKNFAFPFVARDVRVAATDVVETAASGGARFEVTVETASGVGEPALDYRITNEHPVAARPTSIKLLKRGLANDGWQIWSAPEIHVARNAVVAFSITYRRGDHLYFDDNHHRGYLAPPPPDLVPDPVPSSALSVPPITFDVSHRVGTDPVAV